MDMNPAGDGSRNQRQEQIVPRFAGRRNPACRSDLSCILDDNSHSADFTVIIIDSSQDPDAGIVHLRNSGNALSRTEFDRLSPLRKLFEEKLRLLPDSLAVDDDWRKVLVAHGGSGVQVLGFPSRYVSANHFEVLAGRFDILLGIVVRNKFRVIIKS
jgi:hypothetical protein